MSNVDNWIENQLCKAQVAHPIVSEHAVSRLRRLLKGRLGGRPLGAADLANIAKILLEDMAAEDLPSPKEIRED